MSCVVLPEVRKPPEAQNIGITSFILIPFREWICFFASANQRAAMYRWSCDHRLRQNWEFPPSFSIPEGIFAAKHVFKELVLPVSSFLQPPVGFCFFPDPTC